MASPAGKRFDSRLDDADRVRSKFDASAEPSKTADQIAGNRELGTVRAGGDRDEDRPGAIAA